MAIKCEVTQESGDLFFAHLLRVTLIVEENETANPIDVSLFRRCCRFHAQVPADTNRGIWAAECHLRKEDFREAKGIIGLVTTEKGPGQAPPWSVRSFDKGRALEAMVSEARSWEQGARSGRRDSAALSRKRPGLTRRGSESSTSASMSGPETWLSAISG